MAVLRGNIFTFRRYDFMRRFFSLIWLVALLLPWGAQAGFTNETILRATAAVQAAVPRAQADPLHPVFHVTSPAQWMNDPNGPIFFKGYYHLFYQLTPFSDESGVKYWGHVRSRDLARWERLPIALWPSAELGEASIWSGCCAINGLGQPMCFYTSIGEGKSAFDQATQWAATSDDDLITWKKSPANPVLSEAVNAGTKIYDWRDPFIFHEGKRTFLVLGGHLKPKGDAAVNLYEAQNAALTEWKYRGVLFALPDAPTAECPNFFKVGDHWVLFVSPYGKVQYFVGDFDPGTGRFESRTRGLVDYGTSFYAPNTMQVPDGRRLVWGWIKDFPGGRGWNGCLSLPRQLSVTREGQLKQSPAPQLSKLRGRPVSRRNLRLGNRGETLTLPRTNTLEILAELDLRTASGVTLEFKGGSATAGAVVVGFDGTELRVADLKAPLTLAKGERRLSLRIFFDRSVMEVFANDTACITKVISPLDANATLEIRAEGGEATAKMLRAWPLKTIW